MMVYEITGCVNCPLYDETGTEYGVWCHHPDRKMKVGHYSEGTWYPSELPEEKQKEYIAEHRNDSNRVNTEDDDNWIWIEEVEIEDDKDYNPITPDWCPLNKDDLTIKKVTANLT